MRNIENPLEPAQWHRRFCAITPWLALSGDLDSVDRGDIDKKIHGAKQKLPKK